MPAVSTAMIDLNVSARTVARRRSSSISASSNPPLPVGLERAQETLQLAELQPAAIGDRERQIVRAALVLEPVEQRELAAPVGAVQPAAQLAVAGGVGQDVERAPQPFLVVAEVTAVARVVLLDDPLPAHPAAAARVEQRVQQLGAGGSAPQRDAGGHQATAQPVEHRGLVRGLEPDTDQPARDLGLDLAHRPPLGPTGCGRCHHAVHVSPMRGSPDPTKS